MAKGKANVLQQAADAIKNRTRIVRPDNLRVKLSQAKSAKIVADAIRKHVSNGGNLPPELDNALAVFSGTGSTWIGTLNG